MTTIAIKDGEVAADTQLTSDTCIHRAQKVFRLPDGGVATGEGSWGRCYAFIQWLMEGESGDPPQFRGGIVYVVRPDKSIWIAEGEGPLYPVLDHELAAGCGRDIARSALGRGLSPLEAVREACAYDLATSEPIQTMTVCTPAELPGAVTHAPKRKRA